MKGIKFLIFALLISCNEDKTDSNVFNPGQEWKDNNGVHINAHGGGILYFDKTYYWYGEHKIEGKSGNTSQVGVHVYSSKDLYNWNDEGIALSVDSADSKSDIAKGCILERPKVIYNKRTQKFVMWFHLELKGMKYKSARSGVAISNSPNGPFKFINSFRPNAGSWPVNVQPDQKLPFDTTKDNYSGEPSGWRAHQDSLNLLGRDYKNGQMARDMNLFVDDDGKAYHLYSSEGNSTLHISELTDDYLSYSGKFVRVFSHRYMEASTILKTSDGKYYYIGSGCSGWKPNAARHAVADNIFGPWKELGNPCTGKDSSTTFNSQSTFILPINGKKDAFIFMADRWTPKNPINGKYVWLPVKFNDDRITLDWKDKWDLSVFD